MIVGTSLTNVGVALGMPAGELVSLRVTAINAIVPNLGSPSVPITLTASSLPNASTYI